MPQLKGRKPIDRTVYKYCLKSIYDSLNAERKQAFNVQREINGIGRSTFSNYCNIKFYDEADIPAKRLDILGTLLNVDPSFLKNYQIEKAVHHGNPVLQTRV